jgi:hypothetical protein
LIAAREGGATVSALIDMREDNRRADNGSQSKWFAIVRLLGNVADIDCGTVRRCRGAAKETATSVEQLISNAMTALLSRGVLLPDDDGALEKYCVSCVWLRQAFQGIHRTGKTTNGWDIDAEKQRETTRQDSVPLRLKLLIQFNLSTPPLGTIKINDLASLRQCG